jgi:hypothetical protein
MLGKWLGHGRTPPTYKAEAPGFIQLRAGSLGFHRLQIGLSPGDYGKYRKPQMRRHHVADKII